MMRLCVPLFLALVSFGGLSPLHAQGQGERTSSRGAGMQVVRASVKILSGVKVNWSSSASAPERVSLRDPSGKRAYSRSKVSYKSADGLKKEVSYVDFK